MCRVRALRLRFLFLEDRLEVPIDLNNLHKCKRCGTLQVDGHVLSLATVPTHCEKTYQSRGHTSLKYMPQNRHIASRDLQPCPRRARVCVCHSPGVRLSAHP